MTAQLHMGVGPVSAVPGGLVPGSGPVGSHIYPDLHVSISISTGGHRAMDVLENQFATTIFKYVPVTCGSRRATSNFAPVDNILHCIVRLLRYPTIVFIATNMIPPKASEITSHAYDHLGSPPPKAYTVL